MHWVFVPSAIKSQNIWINGCPSILKAWHLPKPLLVPQRQTNTVYQCSTLGCIKELTQQTEAVLSIWTPMGRKVTTSYAFVLTTTYHDVNSFRKQLWWGTVIDLLDIDPGSSKGYVRLKDLLCLSFKNSRMLLQCTALSERHASFHSSSYCSTLLCGPSRSQTDDFI